jgi:hypothetical protein
LVDTAAKGEIDQSLADGMISHTKGLRRLIRYEILNRAIDDYLKKS